MRSSRSTTGLVTLLSLLLVGSSASAQDVIELYDGKAKSEKEIDIGLKGSDAPSKSGTDDPKEASKTDGESDGNGSSDETDPEVVVRGVGGDSSGTSVGTLDGAFTIAFERLGSSILVPVTIHGEEAYFIFDTGASITTVSPQFAQSAGIYPDSDAVRGRVRTANGVRETRYGLIENLTLGGRTHTNVSFSLCPSCAAGHYKKRPIVGLLGLNVLRRYRTEIDDGEGIIKMTPGSNYGDRYADVRPWVKVEPRRMVPVTTKQGDRLQITAKVTNQSDASITSMRLELQCLGGDGKHATAKSKKIDVGARSSTKITVRTTRESCPGAHWEVTSARW